MLGGPQFVAPSDKVTLAYIGLGTQGIRELLDLITSNDIQVVAVCDPNTDSNDYVDWSKNGLRDGIRKLLGKPQWREGADGIPGGREVGREIVETYYAGKSPAGSYKGCASYADFRELLEKQKDVDAVKIMTPDHLHATISIAAMKKGKHVMMHKPIANRLYEARLGVGDRALSKVATHFIPGTARDRWIWSWLDQGRRDRHAARGPQLVEPAGVAAVPDICPRIGRRSRRAWIGTCGWVRRSTGLIIRTIRTRCFAAGTISAAARLRIWATTACGWFSAR